MRRLTVSGVCLAVLVAFAAVSAAGAAAAEPALYQCVKASKVNKKYTGKFNDKKCSSPNEKGEGKYELKEGFGKGKPFKGKGGGANLEVTNVGGISCTKSSDTGKFTSPKTAGDIVVTFTGCEYNDKTCESGAKAAEIVTDPLKGEVGYLAGKGTKTPTVGAEITAETGGILATFHCGSEEFEVNGAVIGEVTPANTFTKSASFIFQGSGKIGEQKWRNFEEGPEASLNTGICKECAKEGKKPLEVVALAADEETTVVNKGEELELKA